MEIFGHLRGIFGVVVLLAIAWSLSTHRKKVPWRVIAWGLGLQIVFSILILKTTAGKAVFDAIRDGAARLISFSDAGAGFLFGNLYKGIDSTPPGQPGWQLSLVDATGTTPVQIGVVAAFHVLPIIIFFSSLVGVLYHLGIMQRIVRGFAWVMRRTMKISGAESLAAAANIFVGNVEAPLVVRPFIATMTRSELALVMISGFATVAGSVMAVYVRFGVDAGHLLAASVMSGPAAVVVAKLMFPETGSPATQDSAQIKSPTESVNIIDAAASGALQGLKIAATVGAMLIAFLSLIAMINFFLGLVNTSLGELLGIVFSPLAFCMGVDSADMTAVGRLLGTKVAITEFVAYLDLVSLKDTLSPKSFVISTYALCGFASFGSVAIAIGGVGQIAPSRRTDLARLGLKAMLGGAMASWLTASIAGIVMSF
ncbi:MAG: nucleoside transporter C-terminal domain-containing protein [Myxococcota bacterium]|nr:nucleoside transporter C-terminal domain-containing protein [Myxococcota bacterium]